MSSIIDQDTDRAALLTDFVLADLQLRHQPFTSAPNDGEWFLDDIAQSQLEDIKQALISGDDLLLILGPAGSGKSTLLSQLGANSGQRIQCFSVRGSERFSTANLFAGMLEAFKKSPPDDLKLMLDDLIPSLQGMADHNTLGAVVLDDADQIPSAELTKLLSGMLYINSSDETLLRVVLAGPTEFEERIPELLPEGADLPYSSLAIEAFDKERTGQYLSYRLQSAGGTGELPFADNELAQINKDAGGRPGELHAAAAQFLNSQDENYVAELPPELKSEPSGSLARFGGMKLLAGLLALAMIFAGLFWLRPKTNTVPDDRYKVVEKKKLETEQKSQELKLLAEQQAAEQEAKQQAQNNQSATGSTTSNNATISTATAEQTAEQAAAAAAAEAEAAKAEAQRQAKLEREAAEKLAQAEQQKLAEEKAAKEKAAKEQAAKEQAAKEKAEKEKAEKELAAKKAAEEAAAASAAKLSNLESPNWILVQNPSLFTVQMSAATDRKSVEAFLAKNQLEAPNSIFSFNRNGATWYALVHGLYGSIEEARKDIEQMPESARSNQPWIRAVGRIQNAMKNQ